MIKRRLALPLLLFFPPSSSIVVEGRGEGNSFPCVIPLNLSLPRTFGHREIWNSHEYGETDADERDREIDVESTKRKVIGGPPPGVTGRAIPKPKVAIYKLHPHGREVLASNLTMARIGFVSTVQQGEVEHLQMSFIDALEVGHTNSLTAIESPLCQCHLLVFCHNLVT